MQDLLFEQPPHDLYHFERQARAAGYTFVAGIDEAGRGPLAGPVIAAAVILNPDAPVEGVNDSKKLTEQRRERLFELIMARALAVGVGQVDAATIDQINILQATRRAMLAAVQALSASPDLLLIDGITTIASPLPQQTIKQGDSRSASIAAASIIAKVTRDRMMGAYDKLYPDYGFLRHKGYGSAVHLAALRQHGPCPIHRMTFAGVKP
ncbi:ribonuclease HII [Trichlorobacter lovleyi]|uniref:Ribonuclease HII n=1 Tax=Trichlorobacter lovleyi (strain ATCC BAA-1151 / DSM 17278 / SZ) TaxID=398767 RepID=B3E5S9_TRIL1|nr:ribonuclease HII [Trichlorobacter lovleyi]ACD96170.1 Ribonuclease H [Trichlorobacter lovleyi SZ]